MNTLFPIDLAAKEWVLFRAEGFAEPVCGVIYRSQDNVPNGMPLGGIDTGCIDLETSGLLGYCTIFNTFAPRRGPLNVPLLGLSVDEQTWVLCKDQPKEGVGEYQYIADGSYRRWSDKGWEVFKDPLKPGVKDLSLDGVKTVSEIHYWGHYPVADVEFESDIPIGVGLRAWSPFLPGDVRASMIPGIVFEVHLRNPSNSSQRGTLAISFPGPDPAEAGTDKFLRREVSEKGFSGVEVTAPLASYVLSVIDCPNVPGLRLGGELGTDGAAWAGIAKALPAAKVNEPGSSVAIDFLLEPGQKQVVRFALTWHAPTWDAGGYNWAGAPNTFTHTYAKYYPNALETAKLLAQNHDSLLRRILAWQQVIYKEERLPVWLRESLVNILHLITEDGLWAQKQPPLPDWVREEDGLFGMNECPRGCPQTECLPNTFYGNQPLVYFFPELALSTLRGYKGYQFPDGAPTWSFGGCTTGTPPADFANPARGYQFATNGISLTAMIDRYFLCYGDKAFVQEFYPVLKKCMTWTMNLRTTPSYTIGEKVIAMPSPDSGEYPPREWFEADYPGWFGLTAHVGGLHLAQLRITERFAREAGDEEFARQCEEWIKVGSEAMEQRLWTGSYYLNCFDPETGEKSDLVFGYQMDGEWITDHHGLPSALPEDRVRTTLETIKRCNIALTRYGAVNYSKADGTPRDQAKPGTWDYGTYSCFPAELMMLAMNYMYEGQKEFGLELARKVWHNIICRQGYMWQQPNRTRGDADTGAGDVALGWVDYFQSMNIWSLPAAIEGQDFGSPVRPGGLVDRIIKAALG